MADGPANFPELIPERYRLLADSLGAQSPLALMVRESPREYLEDPFALEDPIGEGSLMPLPHLVRKYRDRALYLATPSCVMHCRFCFRRTRLPDVTPPSGEDLEAAVRWLSGNPEVREVIVSGGDPLALGDEALGEVLSRLCSVESVERLRLHTRAPVVCPERVTDSLAVLLERSPIPVSLVLHVAHPLEFTPETRDALARLKSVASALMSQTVLLKGVNADASTLATLFSTLREIGIEPRYLHHLDRVPGSGAFRLPLAQGMALYREAAARLSFDPPPYVLDLPDGSGKTEVSRLSVVEKRRTAEGVQRRYRWTRPEGWLGVGGAEELSWWDVPEGWG